MGTDNFTKLLSFLESVEEPRSDNKCHKLIDILMIAICATLADANGWSDIEVFGTIHFDWFKSFLDLPNGIPSHGTFQRVFSMINSKKLNECLINWTSSIRSICEREIIAIEGNTIRQEFNRLPTF